MTEQKPHPNLSQARDGGYTIIESLVAMIVVSVLMIAIAPVMAFSVATRVQARRTELATQAARAYMDALRSGAIRPTGSTPASPTGFPMFNGAANPPAPTGNLNDLYCYDLDETVGCTNSKKDFYVQGVRNVNNNPTDTGYSLTVRVYRADAPGTLQKEQQSVANSGLGNPNAPLVVMKTEIPPTTSGGGSARQSLCSQLNPTGANKSVCQ